MYIRLTMTPKPKCLRPEMTLAEVRQLRLGWRFRHLPVVDAEGRPVGMVSDRDVRSALPSTLLDPNSRTDEFSRLESVRVDSIMGFPPITVPAEATLDDALLLFDRHRIGALSVVDGDGRLVGIVTVRDVLSAYRKLFGVGQPGSSQIEVRDDGEPALLARVAAALERAGVRCTRLILKEAEGEGAPATLYVRMQSINLHGAHAALRGAGLEWVPPKAGPGAA